MKNRKHVPNFLHLIDLIWFSKTWPKSYFSEAVNHSWYEICDGNLSLFSGWHAASAFAGVDSLTGHNGNCGGENKSEKAVEDAEMTSGRFRWIKWINQWSWFANVKQNGGNRTGEVDNICLELLSYLVSGKLNRLSSSYLFWSLQSFLVLRFVTSLYWHTAVCRSQIYFFIFAIALERRYHKSL